MRSIGKLSIVTFSILLGTILSTAIALVIYLNGAKSPDLEVSQTSLVFSDDGTKIDEFSSGETRYWIDIDQISPYFIDAIIATEDHSFFEHHGFDFKRIIGAILADVKSGSVVQGASTISQQYAKNLYLSSEKTLSRKLKEALYTLRIEASYSKKEILEGYVNTIYFGHGMYGIEAASQHFFGKPAGELTLAESAMLAGVPKGPTIYSPFNSSEDAVNRQHVVLSEMLKENKITSKEMETARTTKLKFNHSSDQEQNPVAPYFVSEIKRRLPALLGDNADLIEHGGLRIYTTLDLESQRSLENAVRDAIPIDSAIQVAAISTEPKSGNVKALVGGRDYSVSTFNRATQSERQPGSTFKPFLYYAALEHGFTPSTLIKSEPTTFTYDNSKKSYSPHNFNDEYADKEITIAQALALSDNIIAVKTHLFLGLDTLVDVAKDFGISSNLSAVPALALGSSPVIPLEMTNAYNIFANGGKRVSPTFITKITDYSGRVLYEWKGNSRQILDEQNTFVMSKMMEGIFNTDLNGYASVTGASLSDKISHDYAAKSGSTETDNWMIGFTPELTTGVWVGYDNNLKITNWKEQRLAKDIWFNAMERELKAVPVSTAAIPKGVVGVHIDPETGLLANDECQTKVMTYFAKGTEPTKYCTAHKHVKARTKKAAKTEPKHRLFNFKINW